VRSPSCIAHMQLDFPQYVLVSVLHFSFAEKCMPHTSHRYFGCVAFRDLKQVETSLLYSLYITHVWQVVLYG
jgi:hypothetical protein